MDAFDVVIVGGGPAGSTCAWQLRRAGASVLVIDRARFPRHKVCGGWITPQVLADLAIDPDEYRSGRVLQPITGFRTSCLGGDEVETGYGGPVSFGIRRCEFDEFLLRRSGAHVWTGTPLASLRRESGGWIVNDAIRTPIVIGAGGHFCPVARALNPGLRDEPVVAAQEVEFRLKNGQEGHCGIDACRPELYFCPDFAGYGWCFRKGEYLNVGLGRLDRHALAGHTRAFVEFLKVRRKVPLDMPGTLAGHAYLVFGLGTRVRVRDGVLLAGDAAGLAYPESGEGIRPAVESGLLAARVVVDASGRYDRDRLASYDSELERRFRQPAWSRALSRAVPHSLKRALGTTLLSQSWFARYVVLNRWFLHATEPPLDRSAGTVLKTRPPLSAVRS